MTDLEEMFRSTSDFPVEVVVERVNPVSSRLYFRDGLSSRWTGTLVAKGTVWEGRLTLLREE